MDWIARAACRGKDTKKWFPYTGKAKKAREICAGCRVQRECLAYGLYEEFGIWGGYDEEERRELRED